MPGLPAETRRLGRQANGVSARDNETVVRHVDAAVVFYQESTGVMPIHLATFCDGRFMSQMIEHTSSAFRTSNAYCLQAAAASVALQTFD